MLRFRGDADRTSASAGRDALARQANVIAETISQRGTTVVRRMVLDAGEATPWHTDPHDRITVVVRGESLAIEYRDGRGTEHLLVAPGQTDWDEPTDRVHRAVNVGRITYEEVAIFFLDRADAVPQPTAE
jgi:quercetin dioxygenase-like cupin family protein